MGCARAKSLIFCSTHMLCLQLEPRYGKIRSDTRHISKVWCGRYIHNDKLVLCAGFWAKCSWIRSFIGVFWSDFHILAYTFQYEKKTKKHFAHNFVNNQNYFLKSCIFLPQLPKNPYAPPKPPKKNSKKSRKWAYGSGFALWGISNRRWF